jgi:uncharacterized protein
MKLTVGNPVEGDDFFDREDEQKRAWRQLERNHLLMLAPRRIGKTSLIYRLRDTAQAHGFYSVYCSFAGCNDERDCVGELFKALHPLQTIGQKTAEMFGWIKSVKISEVGLEWRGTGENWRQAGEEIAKALTATEYDWLICIDELPVFITKLLQQGQEGRQRAHTFLYWLRTLRQSHYKKVKWLLAGSIGLDAVAARMRIGDAINDLTPFPLDAFSPECAARFLDALANSYEIALSAEVRDHIIARIGWPVPYYLQLMFSYLYEAVVDEGVPVTVDTIDTLFEKLLGPAYRSHFDYWRQRLDDELGQPDASHAARLLNVLCGSQEGLDASMLGLVLQQSIADDSERDHQLRHLLSVLDSDGYLVRRDGRYAFRLEWLRLYWQREYGA